MDLCFVIWNFLLLVSSGTICSVNGVSVRKFCPSSLFQFLSFGEKLVPSPPSGQGSGGDGGAALDLTNYGDSTQQYYETYEQ